MAGSHEDFEFYNREKGKILLIKMFYVADKNPCYFKYLDYSF